MPYPTRNHFPQKNFFFNNFLKLNILKFSQNKQKVVLTLSNSHSWHFNSHFGWFYFKFSTFQKYFLSNLNTTKIFKFVNYSWINFTLTSVCWSLNNFLSFLFILNTVTASVRKRFFFYYFSVPSFDYFKLFI